MPTLTPLFEKGEGRICQQCCRYTGIDIVLLYRLADAGYSLIPNRESGWKSD